MSVRNLLVLVSIPALLAACSTTQESPIYQQSTKYKVHSPYQTTTPTTQQATYTTATPYHQTTTYTTGSSAPAYHQTTSSTGEVYTTQVNHECLDKEGDRKLIGTALGGAAGALAGNQIGDNTTGTIIGGVVGAAAGYGIADITTNCDPVQVATPASATYQTPAPVTYQTPTHTTTTSSYPAGYHAIDNSAATAPTIQDATTTHQMINSEAQNGQAPTDSAYGETFGTPGYHAMIANGELDETQTASVVVPETPAAPTPAPAPSTSYPQIALPSQPQYTSPGYPQTTTPAPAPQYVQSGVTSHQVVEGDTVYSLSRRLCVDVEDIRRLNSLNSEFYIRLDDYIKLPASRC